MTDVAAALAGRRSCRAYRPEPIAVDLLDTVLGTLDDRARHAVEARFGLLDGRRRSYREVGEDLGVTAEAARRLVKRSVLAVRENAMSTMGAA